MNVKKMIALYLALMICFSAAGCGRDRESDPSEMQTPQYSIPAPPVFDLPPEDEIHTADRGVRVIQSVAAGASSASLTPATVWDNSGVVTWNGFTMPEHAAHDDGSIGVLSIPRIGVTVRVYQSESQMEDMEKGAAHFKCTSAWDGNIGLSAVRPDRALLKVD